MSENMLLLKNDHYFKYRDVSNLMFFMDILLRKRLYMSTYSELNDPMEGVFLYDKDSDSDAVKKLWAQKKETHICSLSRNSNNMLMWAHYSKGHTGCCIELSVTSRKADLEVRNIDYSPQKANLCEPDTDIYKILSVKSPMWKYEEETRFFLKSLNGRKPFLSIKIHKIIFGMKVSRKDFDFYKRLINAIDEKIEVTRIKRDELNTGYENT